MYAHVKANLVSYKCKSFIKLIPRENFIFMFTKYSLILVKHLIVFQKLKITESDFYATHPFIPFPLCCKLVIVKN